MGEVTYKRPATKEPKDKETSQVELSKGGETIKRPLPFELIIPIRTKLIMEQPRVMCSHKSGSRNSNTSIRHHSRSRILGALGMHYGWRKRRETGSTQGTIVSFASVQFGYNRLYNNPTYRRRSVLRASHHRGFLLVTLAPDIGAGLEAGGESGRRSNFTSLPPNISYECRESSRTHSNQ